MRWVIDASAGIQIVLNRDFNERIEGLLKDNIINTPQLYIAETGNRFWKYTMFQDMPRLSALKLHQQSLDLVDHFIPLEVLSQWALEISTTHNITFYDALYLTLAKMQNCGIISFDKKLIKTAETLNIKTI